MERPKLDEIRKRLKVLTDEEHEKNLVIHDTRDEVRRELVSILLSECPEYIEVVCQLERLKKKEKDMRGSLEVSEGKYRIPQYLDEYLDELNLI